MKFEFSTDVRTVLKGAHAEAQALKHDSVSPLHILLSLVRHWSEELELPPLADPEALRRSLIEAAGPGLETAPAGSLSYSSRAKKSLEYAMADARKRDKGGMVFPNNLLFGVMRADRAAGEMMREHFKRAKLVQRAQASGRSSHQEVSDAVWYLKVDAASETPIYEQIVQRIEEAVAIGKLVANERLPAARELASELEVAPGTVARAYAALEERGVVITEGARGTRVAERTVTRGRDAERESALEALLKPVAVAAFHMGAKAEELRNALDRAMKGILNGIA